jgi:hypothetical protein
MGKAHLINIFVLKNYVHKNLLVEIKLQIKLQIKLFIYRVDFWEIGFFLFIQRADNSSWKS